MFERLSARELVGVITARAQASAAADAEKYAAIAELERRRTRAGVELEHDAVDALDGAAAEIGAALNIGHGRALNEVDIAVMLRDRFPKVAALFARGLLTGRRVWLIERRTGLVTDPDALAALDTVLAERILGWGPLAEYKLTPLIDLEIERIDPDAVRRARSNQQSVDFVIGDDYTGAETHKSGTTACWGRVSVTDAEIARKRMAALQAGLCDDDPRTRAQRRAAAFTAAMAGADAMACQCGDPGCPSADVADASARNVVVHVLTDQASLDAVSAPQPETEAEPAPEAEPEVESASAPEPALEQPSAPAAGAEPACAAQPVAIIPNGAVVPGPLLAELIARGAKVKPLITPTGSAERRYRPSTALDEFIRLRDLTCRAPGCDRPAEFADIDHTVPYPAGPTHPGNGKCYCRKHHLIKTFHAGWSDRQLPDGTVVITTPTGHTYTTKPGITLLFPKWNVATPAPPSTAAPPGEHRTLAMPRRQRTRAQAKADRINAERALNARSDPPPF